MSSLSPDPLAPVGTRTWRIPEEQFAGPHEDTAVAGDWCTARSPFALDTLKKERKTPTYNTTVGYLSLDTLHT